MGGEDQNQISCLLADDYWRAQQAQCGVSSQELYARTNGHGLHCDTFTDAQGERSCRITAYSLGKEEVTCISYLALHYAQMGPSVSAECTQVLLD